MARALFRSPSASTLTISPPPSPEPPPSSETVLAELWAFIATQSDDQLITWLPTLSIDDLECLYDAAGPEQELEPCECECGWALIVPCEECGCEPDFKPGKNFGHYLSPRVLSEITAILYRDPPAPPADDEAWGQEERVEVLELRKELGLGLWNASDKIYEDPEHDQNEAYARIAFTLTGWRAARNTYGVSRPPKNGAVVVSKPIYVKAA